MYIELNIWGGNGRKMRCISSWYIPIFSRRGGGPNSILHTVHVCTPYISASSDELGGGRGHTTITPLYINL